MKFYKDGYTDLRGKFDYASVSTNELDNVKKFSLLVMSEDKGALIREVRRRRGKSAISCDVKRANQTIDDQERHRWASA